MRIYRLLLLFLLFWINCYGMDDPPVKSKPTTQKANKDKLVTISSIGEFIQKAVQLSRTGKILVVFDIDDVLINKI